MELLELLKAQGLDEATCEKILKALEENGAQGGAESGAELERLRAEKESLSKSNQAAQELIKALKASGTAHVAGQPEEKNQASGNPVNEKIKEYEQEIQRIKAENEQMQLESEIKVALLQQRAKPEDVDYLIFQMRKSDADLKISDTGKVRGLDEAVKAIRTAHPSNFEQEGAKDGGLRPLPYPLPKTEDKETGEPKSMAEALRQHYEPERAATT